METSNNGSIVSQPSTCLKMREIVEIINEYKKSRTESSALLINKFLQAYSVTIDVSVFEPDTNLGAQFYVSLYELLFTNVDPQSKMAWNCVDVLCNACRNSSAKQALIDTYQFVPILSRMLGDQLDNLNKKKLLILLQDLTCGIKITWQVSHLPHLFKTLTKWIEDKDQDIVCLSLSVIVNICFKNICAVYTLSRIVDIKKFLRFCLALQGPLVGIHVCKLMIILNHLYDDIPRKSLLNLVTPTFDSIHESLTKNDPVMLRSTVDFFSDMIKNENIGIFKEYSHYIENVNDLIQLINSRKTLDPDATPLPPYDLECMTHILKFIYTLELYKLADLSPMYQKILKFTLEWIAPEKTSYQANILLTTITQNLSETDDNKKLLNLLASKLPTFLSILESASTPVNMDDCKRLASLLQLLRMMLKSSSISESVLNALKQELLMSIFSPVLYEDLNTVNFPRLKVNEDNTTTTSYVDAYIYAVGLVYEVAQYDARWLEMLSVLMDSKNIQTLLALALSGSNCKVKQLVLELSKNSRFPIEKVAASMEVQQNMFISNTNHICNQSNAQTSFNPPIYPVLGYSQIEMFDDVLKSLKRSVQEQNITNESFGQVMELYEYKMASMSHAELSAANALKASNDRCINLEHRLAQLSAEHNKFGQVIQHYEKKLEKGEKAMTNLKTYFMDDSKKYETEIAKRDKLISEIEKRLEDYKTELSQITDQKHSLEEQLTKCENLIKKLEETGNKVEKKLETREQQLKNANLHIDGLNVQIKDLRKMLDQKESKLAELTKNYLATKEILGTITKMAASQNNMA